MLTINANEAAFLRKNGRSEDVHVANRSHKSRHKSYFITESPKTMKLLDKYRKDQIVFTYGSTTK